MFSKKFIKAYRNIIRLYVKYFHLNNRYGEFNINKKYPITPRFRPESRDFSGKCRANQVFELTRCDVTTGTQMIHCTDSYRKTVCSH